MLLCFASLPQLDRNVPHFVNQSPSSPALTPRSVLALAMLGQERDLLLLHGILADKQERTATRTFAALGAGLILGRVGITPHPNRLCTAVAKRSETIKWADRRASFGVVPKLVKDEWGINVK